MVILAGIDEAGFGPILGPLVVSSSVFSVNGIHVESDLWHVLRRSVTKTRKHLAGRIVVADSKKICSRTRGLGHLERSVLTALGTSGIEPTTLHELLEGLCPECLPRLLEYPWYEGALDQSLQTNRADIRIASKVLADDMGAAGMRLMRLHCRCLDVAHYNTLVAQVQNKSEVLFITTTQLIQHLVQAFPDTDLHIFVDRQGGRVHYREHLLRSFPQMDLRIVQESESKSTYVLRDLPRRLHLSFEVGADARHLAVSLASMVSKYVRELLIESMNRYFVALNPELKPTAGYWQDGLRFLNDLRMCLPDFPIDSYRMIRCR
jgi:ribonuclease HII